MTFYLKPPRGLLNLHQLEECVKRRLIFYENICSSPKDDLKLNLNDFEFLVEDSALDRAGHFLLRLFAYRHKIFRHIFLENERKLLEIRLDSYDIHDIKHFLKRLLKHSLDNLKNCNSQLLNELHVVLVNLSSSMLNKEFLSHIFSYEHKVTCEQYILRVPFQHCSALIQNREVNLNGGFAEIPCSIWRIILLTLFDTYLKAVLKEMNFSQCVDKALSDNRIQDIFKELHLSNVKYFQQMGEKSRTFNMSQIKEETEIFPLCMLHLYKILDKTNRLPHNERFDFSLYMKGIGVSLSDSLKFWETLYSKEHTSCSRCTHNWQKNEKRYIYGIRHLYGLEGSRRNYQSRSCRYIQNKNLGPVEEGGCPFRHFDDSNLRKVLKSLLPSNPDEVEVMIHKRNEEPSLSCKLFSDAVLRKITGKVVERNVTIESPVHYYFSMKKQLELTVER
nr:probable DNA primase large subunit [Leptinotarsa decemlineata]